MRDAGRAGEHRYVGGMTETLDRRLFLRRSAGCAAALIAGVAVPRAFADPGPGHPEWGYSGDEGPAHWAALDPAWHACGTGDAQSPIDLPRARPTAPRAATARLRYRAGPVDAVDTGHTIRFVPGGRNAVVVAGTPFRLVQFHEHTPSEHTVGGRAYPGELHFVHQDAGGRHAVLGVFLQASRRGGPADELLGELPDVLDERRQVVAAYDLSLLIPRDGAAYRYSGSLTTPDCEQGIDWFVFRRPIRVSPSVLETFREASGDNARPLQLLNGRTIASARVV